MRVGEGGGRGLGAGGYTQYSDVYKLARFVTTQYVQLINITCIVILPRTVDYGKT